jgi:hypothetical protein
LGKRPRAGGAWSGRRLIWLTDEPAFELSFWCGTRPVMFQAHYGTADKIDTA